MTVLGLCGVVALGLAITHVRTDVLGPFLVPKSLLEKSKTLLADQRSEDQKMSELQKKDTDHDGLNDYDELEVYHTSPYLGDTDSDGVPDTIEIAQGSNPNCPKGRTCIEAPNDLAQASASSSAQDLLNIPTARSVGPDFLGIQSSSTAGAQSFIDAPPEPGSMSAEQIRQYLVSHNLIPKEQLDPLSDAQVLSIYQAAYQEALAVQKASEAPTGPQEAERVVPSNK